MKQVKTIATLGKKTDDKLEKIISSKVDAVLIDNFYGTFEENAKRIEKVKKYRKEYNKVLAIIYDVDHIYSQNKYKLIRLEEDNIYFACDQDVDFIACPFIKDSDEIRKVKTLLRRKDKEHIKLIVKIDCKDALDNIDEILEFADCIMINRDDLGMEISYEDLPVVQKEIIKKANFHEKEVIITTQMLHSMIKNPRPTRAEVSDVANAVIDGVDAIMLGEETACGDYSLEVIEIVNKIATYIEKNSDIREAEYRHKDMDIAHTISLSTNYLIENADIKNIVTYTKSGKTARFISKYRPKVPVLAVVPSYRVARSLAITRGIVPEIFETIVDIEGMIELSSEFSKKHGLAKEEDLILVTAGPTDTTKNNLPPTDFINIKRV